MKNNLYYDIILFLIISNARLKEIKEYSFSSKSTLIKEK